ncbi:hypothetical protein [Heyndrickxia sporothermodurans]|uniref:spr1630 family ClpXP-sensitive toxin n=1 Tax=Heyndrickxia sporothermodurans TaxID=46224 RepID=UPI002E1F8574|nr:hypothetical protein [Heyndrickxia sporothermodurans]MED3654298.1 hypothetical protein [Heyndrickxia sporothermodurans]MED3697495.1 hypothetical protein [Heyndrickxia sporothermodurans]
MEQYKFGQAVNQGIVNGILKGYKRYTSERADKYESMKISDAYAWVKGNHIDDQTANECSELGIEYRKAKAGYTWGYLQFSCQEDRSMFIIKNAKYFNPENVPSGKGIKGNKKINNNNNEHYLKKLAKINEKVQFPESESLFTIDNEYKDYILSIFDDNVLKALENNDVSNLQQMYEKFYIVTYEIDEAHMISSIKVWMPNPINDKAVLVDDLSSLIGNSLVDFADIDFSYTENDDVEYDYESVNHTDFEIDIAHIDKKTSGSES